MKKRRIQTRVDDLEAKHETPENIMVVVPSWGNYVFVDGKAIARSEYEPNPNMETILLSWGDETTG